jgi:catechol 2,3-dioxygenase-like lactoylglutathione lyase family enzyme
MTPAASFPIGNVVGLEHVVFPVRDLQRSSADYRRFLGFSTSPGIPHASGTIDCSVMFPDGTYLELLGIHDPSRDTPIVREVKQFLARREGPITIGVRVASAADAVAYLRSCGCEVDGPNEMTFPDPKTGKPSPPMFASLEIKGHRKYFHDLIFFTEKIEGNWEAFVASHPEVAAVEQEGSKEHANTAVRLTSAWLAVDNLNEARDAYSAIGLPTSREGALPVLDADAAEIPLGRGSLLLIQARSSSGPLADSLSRHGGTPAMMGVSIEVRDLARSRGLIPSEALVRPQPYAGWFGRSLLVAPEHAHGCWLELFEQRSPR